MDHVILLIDDQHRELKRIARFDALYPAAAAAQSLKYWGERVIPGKADPNRSSQVVFIPPCAACGFQHLEDIAAFLASLRQRQTRRRIGDDQRLEYLVQCRR